MFHSAKALLGAAALAALAACSVNNDASSVAEARNSGTVTVESLRAESEKLTNALLGADCRDDEEILDALDAVEPRFWADLTRTGRKETVKAYCKLFIEADRGDAGRFSRGLLMQNALEFAAVNDAIYDESDVLPILQPALGKALGWNERDGADRYARKAADKIATGGTGRNGIYTDIKVYQAARRSAIDEFMTGR